MARTKRSIVDDAIAPSQNDTVSQIRWRDASMTSSTTSPVTRSSLDDELATVRTISTSTTARDRSPLTHCKRTCRSRKREDVQHGARPSRQRRVRQVHKPRACDSSRDYRGGHGLLLHQQVVLSHASKPHSRCEGAQCAACHTSNNVDQRRSPSARRATDRHQRVAKGLGMGVSVETDQAWLRGLGGDEEWRLVHNPRACNSREK